MIRGALKRIFVTEIYARMVLCVLLAMAAGVQFSGWSHPGLAGLLLVGLMAVVYRIRYGRW